MKTLIILSSVLFLTGCFDNGDAQAKVEDSVKLGQITFDKNCIGCHAKAGKGIVGDWKKRGVDGKFPPPPLNGTAHTWHHSPTQLLRTINDGGVKIGGQMPAFRSQLSDDEKQTLLDYIHSLWPSELQHKYDARFKS